jgi:hypothetical protein
LKKVKIIFLSLVFFIILTMQFTFFLFIVKINNLHKILNVKNDFHKTLLLSDSIDNEIKGFHINKNSFALSMPSIDANRTFISNNRDFVVITFDKPFVFFTLLPSEFSYRKNKTIRFTNVRSMQIKDCGFIDFFCNINNETVESIFYVNKNVNLLPIDFEAF